MKTVFVFGIFLALPAFAATVYQCDGGEEPRTILMMSLVPSHSFDYTPVDKTLPASRGKFVRNTLRGYLFELIDLATVSPRRNVYLEFPAGYLQKESFIANRTEVSDSGAVKRNFLCYELHI